MTAALAYSPWNRQPLPDRPKPEPKPVLGLLMAAETLLKIGCDPDVRAAIRDQLGIQDNRRPDNG